MFFCSFLDVFFGGRGVLTHTQSVFFFYDKDRFMVSCFMVFLFVGDDFLCLSKNHVRDFLFFGFPDQKVDPGGFSCRGFVGKRMHLYTANICKDLNKNQNGVLLLTVGLHKVA